MIGEKLNSRLLVRSFVVDSHGHFQGCYNVTFLQQNLSVNLERPVIH